MGMVAHTFNPCNQEAEAGAFLWVPSHGDEGEGEKERNEKGKTHNAFAQEQMIKTQ